MAASNSISALISPPSGRNRARRKALFDLLDRVQDVWVRRRPDGGGEREPSAVLDQGHLTHRDRQAPPLDAVVTRAAVRRPCRPPAGGRRADLGGAVEEQPGVEHRGHQLVVAVLPLAQAQAVGQVVDGDHDVGPETLVDERLDRDQPDLGRGRVDPLPVAAAGAARSPRPRRGTARGVTTSERLRHAPRIRDRSDGARRNHPGPHQCGCSDPDERDRRADQEERHEERLGAGPEQPVEPSRPRAAARSPAAPRAPAGRSRTARTTNAPSGCDRASSTRPAHTPPTPRASHNQPARSI